MITAKKNHKGANSEMRLYLKEISKIPILTTQEEREIGRRIQEGDQKAFQILVESNLRFVIKIAKNYRGCGLPFIDLINEGNLGLMAAARRFDPTRNVKFTSYAVWWIRQSILQSLSNLSHPLRIPPKIASTLYRVGKTINKKTNELRRKPQLDEIATELGLPIRELTTMLEVGGGSISMDAPMSENGDLVMGDLMEQTILPSVEETLDAKFLEKHLDEALDELELNEKKVLRLRFGLDDDTPQTLKGIGDKMGLSRERIRQIEAKALRKLRGAECADRLATYLN